MDAGHDLRPVESSQGAGKLVEQVDRFFFLVWIAIYALLPTSGWASIMFASWFDQKRDLAALRSVIDERTRGRDRTQRHRPCLHRRCPADSRGRPAEPGGLARPPHESQLRPGGRARRRARPSAPTAADRGAADGHHRRTVRVHRPHVRGRHVALVRRSVESLLRGVPRRRRVCAAICAGAAHGAVGGRRRSGARAPVADAELRVRRARSRLGHRLRRAGPASPDGRSHAAGRSRGRPAWLRSPRRPWPSTG